MIIYSLGLLFCLGLLFYFIAKYKESDAREEEFSWEDEFERAGEDTPVTVTQPNEADVAQLSVQDLLEDVREETNAVQQVQKLFTKTETLPSREIFDLKDKVKDFSYSLEENRLLEEKHYNELKSLVETLGKRLSSFENEYMNNLYPMLTTLIKELENLQNKNINN